MFSTIYKYELEIKDKQFLKVPEEFEPLSVQVQNGSICLWAKVSRPTTLREITVYIVGTDNPLPDALMKSGPFGAFVPKYVGTVFTFEDKDDYYDPPYDEWEDYLVWHVFVDTE